MGIHIASMLEHRYLEKKTTNIIHNNGFGGQTQAESFAKLKLLLPEYFLIADTKISADASSYGLWAVLQQKHNGVWKRFCILFNERRLRRRHLP